MNIEQPVVPARVRSVAYFLLLGGAVLILATQGLAPIWFDEDLARKLADSATVLTSVLGLIAGGLGVAYRPTRDDLHV